MAYPSPKYFAKFSQNSEIIHKYVHKLRYYKYSKVCRPQCFTKWENVRNFFSQK